MDKEQFVQKKLSEKFLKSPKLQKNHDEATTTTYNHPRRFYSNIPIAVVHEGRTHKFIIKIISKNDEGNCYECTVKNQKTETIVNVEQRKLEFVEKLEYLEITGKDVDGLPIEDTDDKFGTEKDKGVRKLLIRSTSIHNEGGYTCKFLEQECKADNPPNYEYGYRIQEDKVTQGKDEQRDGIYAKGRYYVENGTESSQDVKYFADDWGYHTVVNYTNTGPYSKSNTNFAFGEEALKLKNNQKSIPNDPSDPGRTKPESSSSTPQPVLDNQLDPSTVTVPTQDAPLHSLQLINDPGNTLDSQIIPDQQQFSPGDPHFQFLTPPFEYQQLIKDDPQTSQHQPIFFYVQPQVSLETQFYGQKPNQLVQLLQNNQNPLETENFELLPKPEALISPNSVDETAPNQLDFQNKEYGSKLSPKYTQVSKLIESTRNLVSGDDVLNINAAISQNRNEDIESGTIANLLKEYVTPTISNNHIDVEINTVSSTTPTNFLKQPIVVAEESKPVNEKTEENENFISSTARSTIASTQKSDDNEVLVTPRPSTVSSQFLAPITAGVQLEQNVEDSKTVNIYEQENKSVQVQKTIPYYLGMYEYPSGFDNQKNTSEQRAIENIELGKTLLYFPEQDSPRAEALIAQPQVTSNNLVVQQQNEAEQQLLTQEIINEQKSNGIEAKDYIQERPSYSHEPKTIEKIVEKPVHIPVEVTKYVDRPYPVEVPVPVPQPYPVEKIVHQIIKEPYPVHVKVPVQVEKIVERKIPVPYYVEKPQYAYQPFPLSSQALLVQVPGLFTQQKYSSLVQNSYAPQNNHYLPSNYPKQNSFHFNNKGRGNNYKLKKLNLLVLPRQNILNLPPITKNPHDLVRHSNAQLNNGYLPPHCDHSSHNLEASASIANVYKVNKPEDHIGLIPPKRPLFEESRKHRHARQFDDKSIRLEYGFMPPLIPSLEIDELGQPIEKN
ncbi:unnamed protein product [Ceutorhynchus assimilis]|uniref:Uncharacterized protein n=1 Tax=Ceutorhynchus assimilis TaxID=467358 RepID=A0A9N9MQM8_9CUCU|nr:unnamed protein product [Ceutorhynchus assimilis]